MIFHYIDITDECFQDYKKISMLVSCVKCDGKCWKDIGLDPTICQNHALQYSEIKSIEIKNLVNRYLENSLTSAVIFGGLEPMLQFDEIIEFIKLLRQKSDDDIVIYTGYYKDEIEDKINQLKKYNNIVIKFGRYIPNREKRYDDVLGINLISDNQYAERIS